MQAFVQAWDALAWNPVWSDAKLWVVGQERRVRKLVLNYSGRAWFEEARELWQRLLWTRRQWQ